MSAEKQVQLLMSNISSLEDSLNELQNHTNNLYDASKINVASELNPNAEPHPDFLSQLEGIKSHIMDKSEHLENVISTALNPEQIQRKVDLMMKVQNRMNYHNRGGR